MKLNVYIARCGVSSRRNADGLIKKGLVQVNGRTVIEPFAVVSPEADTVAVRGREVFLQKKVYLALNKPRGYTCTLKDRFASKKVTSLVPESYGKVFPAGRLDRDTSGLIIITNDGDFAQRLTHPSFGVEKEYEATVEPVFKSRHLNSLKRGVSDGGELLRATGARVIKNSFSVNKSLVSVVLREGRKREVRRMFERLGYSVEALNRVRIGNVELGDIKSGGFRHLSAGEKEFFLKRVPKGKKENVS